MKEELNKFWAKLRTSLKLLEIKNIQQMSMKFSEIVRNIIGKFDEILYPVERILPSR